jgi:hypothetical protein
MSADRTDFGGGSRPAITPLLMMKRLRLLGCVLLAIGGCGSGQRPDLTVTTYSPTRTAGEATPIEVSFDRPVIEDAEVGTPVDAGAVTVSPAVPWTGRWRDRHTLVIEPSEPLKASTRYQVALAGELARRTGGFQFAFVHQPLEVEGIAGADPEALPVDGAWRIGSSSRRRARR